MLPCLAFARSLAGAAVAAGALLITSPPAAAQTLPKDTTRAGARDAGDRPADLERRAQQSRSGAGLRAGTWNTRGLPPAAAGEQLTSSPTIEGYFQRGLDLHLVLENTATVYWQDRTTRSTGPLGGMTASKTRTYIVPLFTSLKVFPFTRPGERVEPYALGGVGFALGIRDPEDGSVSLAQGLGVKGGSGVELRLTEAFGLSLGGRWQWIRFLGEFADTRTVQGFGADVGLTYRFQYR